MGVAAGRGRAQHPPPSPGTHEDSAPEQSTFPAVGSHSRQWEEGVGLGCGSVTPLSLRPQGPQGAAAAPRCASGQEGRTKAPFLPGRARAVMASPSARPLVLRAQQRRGHGSRRARQDRAGRGRCLLGGIAPSVGHSCRWGSPGRRVEGVSSWQWGLEVPHGTAVRAGGILVEIQRVSMS